MTTNNEIAAAKLHVNEEAGKPSQIRDEQLELEMLYIPGRLASSSKQKQTHYTNIMIIER